MDRARLQHRLDSIESALDRLTRESAMNRAARERSQAAPGVVPRVDSSAVTASTSARGTESRAVIEPAWPRDTELVRRVTQGPGDRTPPPIADFPGLRQIREFFTGGNLIVRVGVVVLFFGVAFLLRYVAEHSHFSIETRLSGVAVGALVLLALGWQWRRARRGYALALQGGGVGILYLTTFSAQHVYAVLAPGAAFILLAAVALLAAALAILQDSMAFAILGATGGYLAPVLASNPRGDHVALFSYFALLNCFVLIVAWFRSWRPGLLALIAFAWLNVLLLRTLHQYADVPYTAEGVAASALAQTSLTIFWATLALVGMAWATRSGRRIVWLCGAGLLGLVILKLFLVDLARSGTVVRIVSFLGVGVLMLVIGYLSPIPPRRSGAAA
ncbi:MAG TPA: DUF2339 domain-containing protein [Steroidobacteraceae bacterium]|nr:DUF2339 domain-containing protein [Steroidobacteraceae bacterium]